ncbi:MAG: type II toxin-antitoxin system RelE/ParE family toxin [Candidatus Edwardsbacteria bacterium]|nr:type II toxin-antitoxin system RelE/ParE family toxin [Candidatus Edwardsbacteria bacterium]
MFTLSYERRVFKDLDELPDKDVEKIAGQIERLRGNPFPPGSKKLSGKENVYRIRQGNYRIIYSVVIDQRKIIAWAVNHRKDAYRRV